MNNQETGKTKVFTYNIELFRKRLIIRSTALLVVYAGVLVFSYFQNSPEERARYLAMFLPISLALVFLVFRNFKRQLQVIGKASVEVDDKMFRQKTGGEVALELKLKEIQALKRDIFRSYPRIVLETKDRYTTVLNLLDIDGFQKELEERTKTKTEVQDQHIQFLNWRTPLFFIPSLVAITLCYWPKPYINLNAFFLVLNMNALIYVIYLPEEKYRAGSFSIRRRWIFILGILLLMQVVIGLVNLNPT